LKKEGRTTAYNRKVTFVLHWRALFSFKGVATEEIVLILGCPHKLKKLRAVKKYSVTVESLN
jgi:hypothetical protein